jgi:cyanate permease
MVLQGVGLEVIAFLPSIFAIAVGIMIFATGTGLTSVVRPHIVHHEFGSDRAGYLNGRLARAIQLGRAAGPIAVAWLAESLGYSLSLGILGISFGILIFGYWRFLNDSGAHHPR